MDTMVAATAYGRLNRQHMGRSAAALRRGGKEKHIKVFMEYLLARYQLLDEPVDQPLEETPAPVQLSLFAAADCVASV